MKKTIYLIDSNFIKSTHEYSSIDELKEIIRLKENFSASIGDGASIGNYASIGNRASIGFSASIGDGASIGYHTSIGNDASIGFSASIGHDASIGDGQKIITSLTLNGSKHFLNWWGLDEIKIGCKQLSIKKWKTLYAEIGESEGYSKQEIIEYKSYILMIETMQKVINKQK